MYSSLQGRTAKTGLSRLHRHDASSVRVTRQTFRASAAAHAFRIASSSIVCCSLRIFRQRFIYSLPFPPPALRLPHPLQLFPEGPQPALQLR